MPRWEAVAGQLAILDVPVRCRGYLGDTSTPVVFAEGKLKAKPSRIFKFEDIREAHRVMEAGEANGKMVVVHD